MWTERRPCVTYSIILLCKSHSLNINNTHFSIILMNFSIPVICSYDDTNKYYGKNGSLHCLADPNADIAFVELYNIEGKNATSPKCIKKSFT